MRKKTDAELCVEIAALIKGYIPEWRMIEKKDSWFHRMIGRVSKKYFEEYLTTIGYTMAYPEGNADNWLALSHEGVHGIQQKRWTRPLFGFLYLVPQALAPLFGLLAYLYSPWWLLGLICLGPLPAFWRARWEAEAYALSVMLREWWLSWNAEKYVESIIEDQFKSWSYLKMWPFFTGWVRRRLLVALEQARTWEQVPIEERDPYINGIYCIMKEGGVLSSRNK